MSHKCVRSCLNNCISEIFNGRIVVVKHQSSSVKKNLSMALLTISFLELIFLPFGRGGGHANTIVATYIELSVWYSDGVHCIDTAALYFVGQLYGF